LRDLGAQDVIMGEREIGLGMLELAEGETPSLAATTVDAFTTARALSDQPAPILAAMPVLETAEPAAVVPTPAMPPPEVLEAAIEAAHPEHTVSGPAEPPEMVPALGEMPAEPAEPAPIAAVVEPAVAPPPPPRPKPSAPASTPGAAFNPEVAPVED
jgi:hypothetical protein